MTDVIGKHSRVIGEQRAAVGENLEAQYYEGKSIREISVEIGRSYGFVHRVLIERGVTLRSRGGARVAK